MSRWRPERIRIALHADRAALVRLDGRQSRSPAVRQLVPFAADAREPARIGEAIGNALSQPEWRHGVIEIVLSHALCKLALIPGGIDVRGRIEEEALSRSCLEEANGDLPTGWRVTVAEAPAHLPRLACAVDGALLDAMDAAAVSSAGRIVSLRPLLVDAYNARRTGMARGRFWFVTVEHERCCLVRIHDGVWQSLRVRRLFDDPETELASLLQQERVLAGEEPAPDGLLLCAPNHPQLRLPVGIAPVPLIELPGRAVPDAEAVDFGMALEGLR
ncbi:MAG: hypothetical protein Q8K93_09835 [Reyranella sp.]|nr:hypothetical protein [Sulfuritalea sp.]MDP1962489.1 hypothetical protein [Reyranella sp.]